MLIIGNLIVCYVIIKILANVKSILYTINTSSSF